jgi:hypothetical protein
VNQISTESPGSNSILRHINRELVQRTELRLILLCDAESKKILFDNNPSEEAATIDLRGYFYKAWLDIHEGSIWRIYLASPAPLVALWANTWPKAARLSTLFRFAALTTDAQREFLAQLLQLPACHFTNHPPI